MKPSSLIQLPKASNTARLPAAERVELRAEAGAVEALLQVPESPVGVALICHPHPLYQGTMNNKVVHTLARAAGSCNLINLRFNFRGVGASEGSYAEGIGETEDCLALAQQVRERWPTLPLWLAGFSFGSFVGWRAASALKGLSGLITVAPPVDRFRFAGSGAPDCPWLICQGTEDELVDYRAVEVWASGFEPRPTLKLFEGGSHFFHGRLIELREAAADFWS